MLPTLHPRFIAPLLLALGAPAAQAANATFTDEAAFLAAAGPVAIESFETLAAQPRGLSPISTALLSLSGGDTPIGVQTGPDTPETGFGASAQDGSHYVSLYRAGLPTGTLVITLAAPTFAFGLFLSDVGEAAGQVTLAPDAGAFASGATLLSFSEGALPNGAARFVGLVQTVAFSQVLLTVTGVDEAYGIDKLSIGVVPEPATAGLLGLGLAAVALARRRSAQKELL
jgi:hypothetical protein